LIHSWSVTELTKHISQLFSVDEVLSDTFVSGEISNFKHHSSGHMYFTLKDDESIIKCAMFRSANSRLKFHPEDGMRVIVHGTVSIYPASGTYQLYPDRMEPDGIGSLYLAFEQIKARLEKEGLFDDQRKRKIPFLPRTVGVITSPTGAVIRDIGNVLFRRFPAASVLLAPASVQGIEAVPSLLQALELLQRHPDVDVIIIARGGGSMEDLWAFNHEELARAIYHSKVPVISAIGHETDFTIADFVADLRAPTPSAAAELAVPNMDHLYKQLEQAERRSKSALYHKFTNEKNKLMKVTGRPVFRKPFVFIDHRRQDLDRKMFMLQSLTEKKLVFNQSKIGLFAGKLQALSPLEVLSRGYAVALDEHRHLLTSIHQVKLQTKMSIRLKDGEIFGQVENIMPLQDKQA